MVGNLTGRERELRPGERRLGRAFWEGVREEVTDTPGAYQMSGSSVRDAHIDTVNDTKYLGERGVQVQGVEGRTGLREGKDTLAGFGTSQSTSLLYAARHQGDPSEKRRPSPRRRVYCGYCGALTPRLRETMPMRRRP
jgi:hypothetical protein